MKDEGYVRVLNDVEICARFIAARRLRLPKGDKGTHLPAHEWSKHVEQARALLGMGRTRDDLIRFIEIMCEPPV